MNARSVEYVWLIEERCYGILVNMGAHVSRVKYNTGGIEYEVFISNDEIEFINED
jgi:hypothetical protein